MKAHDPDDPTCVVEVLGDLGTDVRRVGRLASGLWVDVLKPGLVGAGGAASVSVVTRLVVLWAPTRTQNYRWSLQMVTRPNPCVRVCVSVSRVPAGMMKGQSPPATRRVAAVLPPLVPLHLWSLMCYICV